MLLSFVSPELKKKRQEHANGEQEERAAETENTAAAVCWLFLSISLWKKANTLTISSEMVCTSTGHCSAFLSTLAVL